MSKNFIIKVLLTSVFMLLTKGAVAEVKSDFKSCIYDSDNYVEYNADKREYTFISEGKKVSEKGFKKGNIVKISEGYRQSNPLKSEKSMMTTSVTYEICKD